MTANLKPSQVLVLSFFCAIVIGAVLLSMPFSVSEGNKLSLIDSLFTATSATCVTGLVVKDTGSYFSPVGKIIICVLIQIGGLGIMTFSTLFAIVLGKKLTIRENIVIQRELKQQKVQGLRALIRYIVFITLGVEIIGVLCLFFRWLHTENWAVKETFYNAVFHSISAFCNAGFSFFSSSFMSYQSDPYINLIMISLIFLGGIGFIVILDLPKLFSFGNPMKRIGLQTKLVLGISIGLIIVGAVFIFFAEGNNTLKGLPAGTRVMTSIFQAVTPRTAGFNTVDIGKLLPPTLVLLMFFMFIGASPGSTGGGIKTCTFGVLFATMVSMLHNRDRVSVFKRAIPKEIVRRAIVVFFLAITWIFLVTLVLLFTERGWLSGSREKVTKILFEVVSAFGTVGLSTGITSHLSIFGKALIIITMFFGRVGPLTVVLSVAMKKAKVMYSYPEEGVMVG